MLGDIQASAALSPQKYVNDAADEIDSKIGFTYETPIPAYQADGITPTPRPVTLLLKRLTSHLATGRLIMAAYSAQEDARLNAYGQSLVDEVDATIAAIISGELPLPGVPASSTPLPGAGDGEYVTPIGAGINNIDAYSQVEAFYGYFNPANPAGRWPYRG
jgi:hypothetical protein